MCEFVTKRLLVKEWHSLSSDDWEHQSLADVVRMMLTERVTESLPPGWGDHYTEERARQWIEDRDREGATLLVIDRSLGLPVGMMILFEVDDDVGGGVEIRLGYLLAEAAWGQGIANELVRGFVDWCRRADISSIVGGVDRDNTASRRVLEKNGFQCDQGTDDDTPEQLEYRLRL